MAAKPPKPPGDPLNECNQNTIIESNNNNGSGDKSSNTNNNNNATSDNNELENPNGSTTKPNCNCTNISIMHLFHEMKQKFPTIPDLTVANCVNENCHRRENCIQQLRKEVALNPIPAQTYPAKVLQQQRHQRQIAQKPLAPLKPTRAAPAQPLPGVSIAAIAQQENSSQHDTTNNSKCLINSICNSFELAFNNNNNKHHQINSSNETKLNQLKDGNIAKYALDSGIEGSRREIPTPAPGTSATPSSSAKKELDMPTTTAGELVQAPVIVGNCGDDKQTSTATPTPTPTPTPMQTQTQSNCRNEHAHVSSAAQHQRARPTTLNLQSQQQQNQRQQLNIQLQQHFQMRNQAQKPLRKAPLPPLPPKPTQSGMNSSSPIYRSGSAQSQQSTYSNESYVTSPISSGESEISVNVSLSSPTTYQHKGTGGTTNTNQPLKSPIRHRSVINVQPEPPYTRDFLAPPTPNTTSNQKSFTSVNLTLRQPNASVPQSTIDISAGPGLSGNGSGLTYSSTSYDARRGYQKNFLITVTDEGGVFSASRIRPRSCLYPGEHELDGSTPDNGSVNPLRAVASEQNVLQQQHNSVPPLRGHIVASNSSDEMCMPTDSDGVAKTLERQKHRRDKLATALRDNKKRLSQVEQEINILTESVSTDETLRLDNEIQILRCDCEALLNQLENARRNSGSSLRNVPPHSGIGCRHDMVVPQLPQPLPRQRPLRAVHAAVVGGSSRPQQQQQQPQLDFIQHHSGGGGGGGNDGSITATPSTDFQYEAPPPTYQQYYQQYQQRQHASTDDEDYSDTNTDGGGSADAEEMWPCNMCTFRNHPQLNICECCENVRILPGTIRIVTADSGTTSAAC